MAFPSSTQPVHPTLTTSLLGPPQLNAFHPIPMAFNHNINSGNLHASSSTSVSRKRKFFDVVLENGKGGPTTPAHHRGAVGRSDHIVSSSRSLRAEPNFGKYFIASLTIIIIYLRICRLRVITYLICDADLETRLSAAPEKPPTHG